MAEIPFLRVQLIQDGSLSTSNVRIADSEEAKALFEKHFLQLGETRELFLVATLDANGNVTALVNVSTGTVDASIVHPREVFRVAVMNGASSIILAHNHPSGDPTPSEADIKVTRRLLEGGELLGISVVDHIIVGNTAISMRDKGHLPEVSGDHDIVQEPQSATIT